jgi:DNA-directed RNA polymerase subunit F
MADPKVESMFSHIKDETVRKQTIEAHEAAVKETKESLLADINTKIEEATAGLKNKNQELLDEKKKIQDTLKNFENIDPKKAKEALEFLETNTEAQLIKEGRIDEILEKRTSQLKSEHETVLTELNQKLEEESKGRQTFESMYKSKMIEDGLRAAALQAKVRPEAIDDVILRGRREFSLAGDGSLEARDSEGRLRKTTDDKILTPTNWTESLKKTHPHYWPESQGVGLRGRYSTDPNDYNAALADAASKGDTEAYRKLRQKGKV